MPTVCKHNFTTHTCVLCRDELIDRLRGLLQQGVNVVFAANNVMADGKGGAEWARRAVDFENAARALLGTADQPAAARIGPDTPNDDMVICPHCTSQFRAIPVNVQRALFRAVARPAPEDQPTAADTNESHSGGNPGEPKACTPAEERGIAGATGAGQLPVGDGESTRGSAERRSPVGTPCTPTPDESNRHPCNSLQPAAARCHLCNGTKTVLNDLGVPSLCPACTADNQLASDLAADGEPDAEKSHAVE